MNTGTWEHETTTRSQALRALIGAIAAVVLAAIVAAPAMAAPPGLPLSYDYKQLDSGNPAAGSSFGWGTASADFTGDGKPDLLVAQGQGSQSNTAPTFIFLFDGVTGQRLVTLTAPEANFDGTDPIIGFVYVESSPDLGSCPGGDGADADMICDAATISGPDQIPEILIAARELQVDAGGDGIRNAGDPKVGRGYVIDGAMAAAGKEVVLKRIDMPLNDRILTNALGGGSTNFGRVMMVPQGLPPCAGPASEVNNLGVGPCPGNLSDSDPIFGKKVRRGDVTNDLNAEPDIVMTARNFRDSTRTINEIQRVTIDATGGTFILSFAGNPTGALAFDSTPAQVQTALNALPGIGTVTVTGCAGATCGTTAAPYVISFAGTNANINVAQLTANSGGLTGGAATATPSTIADGNTSTATAGSECANVTTGTCTSGKAWVYRGEDIVVSDPSVILESPPISIKNPFPQTTGGGEFGGNVFRLGDINPPSPPSIGNPDFVIAARGAAYPLNAPQPITQPNIGAAYLFNGATGALITTYPHPQPVPRASFSGSFNSGRPAGDLGLTGLPDVVIPAPNQTHTFADDGAAYVFRGDAASPGQQGGFQFATVFDPDPSPGGNFGSSTTGVGNLVDGPNAGTNEMMIGSWAPFDPSTEPVLERVGRVNIVNPLWGTNLQTIKDPTGERGSGFGVGMTPMGDLNGDGFLDYGITAYLSDAQPGDFAAQGRAYILYSNNTPLPTPAAALASGACANRTATGTTGDDVLQGTAKGDTIFALAGNDQVTGLADSDCVDGAAGKDKLAGGDGDDSLLGGTGKDMIQGGAGDDRLFGMSGRDKLVSGKGDDLLDGGKGNDMIDARGGGKDRIVCGGGRDKVLADASDRVSSDCERVKV